MNEKLKCHFQKYQDVYILAGVILVSVGAGILIGRSINARKMIKVVGDAATNMIDSRIETVLINPTVNVHLERRGHPGYLVQCLETGEVFASQNRAANVFGLSPARISDHLNGRTPDLGGFHFQRLGEAQ